MNWSLLRTTAAKSHLFTLPSRPNPFTISKFRLLSWNTQLHSRMNRKKVAEIAEHADAEGFFNLALHNETNGMSAVLWPSPKYWWSPRWAVMRDYEIILVSSARCLDWMAGVSLQTLEARDTFARTACSWWAVLAVLLGIQVPNVAETNHQASLRLSLLYKKLCCRYVSDPVSFFIHGQQIAHWKNQVPQEITVSPCSDCQEWIFIARRGWIVQQTSLVYRFYLILKEVHLFDVIAFGMPLGRLSKHSRTNFWLWTRKYHKIGVETTKITCRKYCPCHSWWWIAWNFCSSK